MSLVINYGHIGRSDELESFITEKVSTVINHKKDSKEPFVEVWVDRLNPRNSSGAPVYQCSMSLKRGRMPRIFAKKKDTDFFRCFKKAKAAVDKTLRRRYK